MQTCNLAGVIRKRCPVDEDLITPFSSGLFALHSEFTLGCKPIALSHSTRHASPQAVNRTGTTPCCKLQSRFATRRRTNPVVAKKGRIPIASRDKRRSDRKKVWVCFR